MRDTRLMFRIALVVALAVKSAAAAAQSDTSSKTPDSVGVNVRDTVRVWSSRLKFKGKRGVVSRVAVDTLAFIAPSGFRKLPREYVANEESVDRLDVLEGRRRSFARAGGKMLFGGVVGAVGGALVGTGIGTLYFELNKERIRNPESDFNDHTNRSFLQLFGAIVFGAAGAAGGALGGAIDGARSYENWRRVR